MKTENKHVQLQRIVEVMSQTPLHQIFPVEATCWLWWRYLNCLLEHHSENMTICLDHEQVLGNVFQQHATKCCSILKIHRRKTQGSKRITLDIAQQFKAKNFDVQPDHMLCHQCINAYKNIINASSSETEVETPMDDTDEDALDDATNEMTYEVDGRCNVWNLITTRKRPNTSLETVSGSPVKLHGAWQHSRATSAKQKLDKVVDTYKSTIAEAYNVSKDVLDTWLCF